MRKVFPIFQKFSPDDAESIKWILMDAAQQRALEPCEIELLLRMHEISCESEGE